LWILVSGKKGVAMANVEYKVIKGAEKDAEPVVATWIIRSGKRQLEGLWVARESRV